MQILAVDRSVRQPEPWPAQSWAGSSWRRRWEPLASVKSVVPPGSV